MMGADLRYARPAKLEEALDFLSQYGKETAVIAGGTDIVVDLRSRALPAGYLLDISR